MCVVRPSPSCAAYENMVKSLFFVLDAESNADGKLDNLIANEFVCHCSLTQLDGVKFKISHRRGDVRDVCVACVAATLTTS